jgi:hypothetical protein
VVLTNCDANHAGWLFTQQTCSHALSAVRPVMVNTWPTGAALTTDWPWLGPERKTNGPSRTSARGADAATCAVRVAVGEITAALFGVVAAVGAAVTAVGPADTVDETVAASGAPGDAVVERIAVDWARASVGDGGLVPVSGSAVAVGGKPDEVGDGGGVHGSELPPGVLPLMNGMTNPTTRARTSVMTISGILERRSPKRISRSWTQGSVTENGLIRYDAPARVRRILTNGQSLSHASGLSG